MSGIIASTIDRGLVCLLLGLAHRLLLKHQQAQLMALLAIEVFWILVRLKMTNKGAYKMHLLVLIWNLEGFIRIFLIMSFHLYDQYPILREFIN